jgi:hypothetical protein
VAGAAWRAAVRTVAGVGDLVPMTGDSRTGRVLSGRAVERSGGTVCGLHLHVETRSAGFLVEPQNQGRWFVSALASKPLGRFLLVWPQNQWQRFFPVWPHNRRSVSWLSLKTKVVEGFPVWASKPAALVW